MLAWSLGCGPPSLAKPPPHCGLEGVSRAGLRADAPFTVVLCFSCGVHTGAGAPGATALSSPCTCGMLWSRLDARRRGTCALGLGCPSLRPGHSRGPAHALSRGPGHLLGKQVAPPQALGRPHPLRALVTSSILPGSMSLLSPLSTFPLPVASPCMLPQCPTPPPRQPRRTHDPCGAHSPCFSRRRSVAQGSRPAQLAGRQCTCVLFWAQCLGAYLLRW